MYTRVFQQCLEYFNLIPAKEKGLLQKGVFLRYLTASDETLVPEI